MSQTKIVGIFLALLVHTSMAQENIQTRIPNSLAECYNNPAVFDRDNRLPSTVNLLIELIRRVEDEPGFNMDMRTLSTSLVHRFRMDGIERAPGIFQPTVLPFSPSGFQFSKHRVLLQRLLPGANNNPFPNNSLSLHERCALHFMMSTSIERAVRNDEGTVCNQLSQYRAQRIPRGSNIPIRKRRSVATGNNFIGDVELMEELNEYHNRKSKKSGRYEATEDGEIEGGEEVLEEAGTTAEEVGGEEIADDTLTDADAANVDAGVVDVSNTLSQCPVENGVMRTVWGAVSVGPLITGIATGLTPQIVPTRELLALSRANGQMARQTQPLNVDNRWAATLSGDLAEVALLQGPMSQQIQVGGVGGWNSTTVPRWYFLSQRDRLEMTDAEIRGGLDGLILALNVESYRSRAPNMRLSQLLDMYYSQRGVFSTNVVSCNRRGLFAEVAPLATMQAQTTAFSAVLDREMQLRVTLPNEAIQRFSDAAAQALITYIPQSLNDPTCATTSIVPRDLTIWRTAAQIFIYVDITWTFREVQPVIAQLLENIDVSRYGSTFTLMNANDAAVIIGPSNSLSDFYTLWNNTVHQTQPAGFSLPNVLRSLRNHTRFILDAERTNSSVGGQSLVGLIVPHQGGVSEADSNFAIQETQLLREEGPDMHVLFLAGGATNRFARFVRQENRDIFPLAINANVAAAVNPVIQRVQTVPRRIINHRCGNNWQSTDTGSNSMNQYVERGGLNLYRVHPNYFFGTAENQRIRVQGHGYSTITVCTSRYNEQPRINMSTPENDINCQQLTTGTHEFFLGNACDGHFVIHQCPPLFISVEGTGSAGEDITFRCNDFECRFPDSFRFNINAENLGCFSGVGRTVAALTLLVTSVLVTMWM